MFGAKTKTELLLLLAHKAKPLAHLYHKLFLFDKLTLGVLAVLPVLYLLSGRISSAGAMLLGGHPLIIAGALVLIHRQESLPAWLRLLRYGYPVLCLTFFFGEVGGVVNAFLPFWLEPYLIRSDEILLGGRHGWQVFMPLLPPVGVEILAFAYWAYFLLLPGIAWLHYRGKSGNADKNLFYSYERVLARLCVVMYTCYTLFLVLPARGPHHALQVHIETLLSGGWFFHAVLLIQKKSAVMGAAFPSSHVAAAFTLWLTLRHDFRIAFWSLLPVVALLAVSTFLLQYHYIVDAAAGILLSLIVEWVMSHHEAPPAATPALQKRTQYAWQE